MEDLCAGLPKCILNYMNYCRLDIKFTGQPDYDMLKSLFQDELDRIGNSKFNFDWVT